MRWDRRKWDCVCLRDMIEIVDEWVDGLSGEKNTLEKRDEQQQQLSLKSKGGCWWGERTVVVVVRRSRCTSHQRMSRAGGAGGSSSRGGSTRRSWAFLVMVVVVMVVIGCTGVTTAATTASTSTATATAGARRGRGRGGGWRSSHLIVTGGRWGPHRRALLVVVEAAAHGRANVRRHVHRVGEEVGVAAVATHAGAGTAACCGSVATLVWRQWGWRRKVITTGDATTTTTAASTARSTAVVVVVKVSGVLSSLLLVLRLSVALPAAVLVVGQVWVVGSPLKDRFVVANEQLNDARLRCRFKHLSEEIVQMLSGEWREWKEKKREPN